VSIGLVVHNGEPFLREALDSLLAQTFTDFELIISDNASEDATESICREYAAKDPRVSYSRNVTNIGSARNGEKVLAAARGEYYMFGSDDDVWAPSFIQQCLEGLQCDPATVLCFPTIEFIDELGGPLSTRPDVGGDWAGMGPLRRFHRALRISPSVIYGVMRTEAVRKVLPLPPVLGPDHILRAALGLQGPFKHVPAVLFFRRRTSQHELVGRAAREMRKQQLGGVEAQTGRYNSVLCTYSELCKQVWATDLGMATKLGACCDAWLWLIATEAWPTVRRAAFWAWYRVLDVTRPIRQRLGLCQVRGARGQ